MKITSFLKGGLVAVLSFMLLSGIAFGQTPEVTPLGTGFTYQGQLKSEGIPYNGICDFQFGLYDAATMGTAVGETTLTTVTVSEGLFTVSLDFGSGKFTGDNRWLEIWVRCPAGAGNYQQLLPRQPLTAAPYALYAPYAGESVSANTVPWSGLSDVPAGFADGVDNDTTYGAGTGLNLTGTTFSVNLATVQSRVTGACGTGSAISSVNADGTVTCEPVGNIGWSLTGNAGTTPGMNFIGTTDNKAFEIKVNNQRVLRLEPNDTSPNLVGGHAGNWVSSDIYGGTISGGGGASALNRVTNHFGTIGGGNSNAVSGYESTISGGSSNTASGDESTISGGFTNTATGIYSTVSGGIANNSSSLQSTISGGFNNTANGTASTISGGSGNTVNGAGSNIGGGQYNEANGQYSVIAGGGPTDPADPASSNKTFDNYCTIGGGGGNQAGNNDDDPAIGTFATVTGGIANIASGTYSTVGGGSYNTASGTYSVVLGGHANSATGDLSLAAGNHAIASNQGSFVWADSQDSYFLSTSPNTFNIRAKNGVYINADSNYPLLPGMLVYNNSAGSAAGEGTSILGISNSDFGGGVAGWNWNAGAGVGAWSYLGNLIEAYSGDYPTGILRFYVDKEGNVHYDGSMMPFVEIQSPVDGKTSHVSLYGISAAEAWYEDLGTAMLINGKVIVDIDPLFGQTVSLVEDYQVQVTAVCNEAVLLFITEKTPTSFTVQGVSLDGKPSSCGFDYRISAKPLGSEELRLESIEIPEPIITERETP